MKVKNIVVRDLWANLVNELLVLTWYQRFEHTVFQSLFGEIMTLLIAMEFNHTIHLVAMRRQNIIQVKTVLLIAILALARKVIIMDLHAITSGQIEALAAITLALGIVYWLMRERDDRLRGGRKQLKLAICTYCFFRGGLMRIRLVFCHALFKRLKTELIF